MNLFWSTRIGLACCVVTAVAAAALGNLLVMAAQRSGDAEALTVPASWEWVNRVVGYVWLGLFAGLGAASWLAFRSRAVNAVRDGQLLIGLLVTCLLYPVYTLGMQAVPGLVANVVVLLMAVVVAVLVRSSSMAAAALVIPVIAWISLATVYLAKLVSMDFWNP